MDRISGDMLIARMERLPLSSFHYRLLVINGIAWAFDAFDVGLITFIATALNAAWHLSPTQMGSLLSIGLVGMLVGAILSGTIADRWGRKAVFQITMLIFSVFSLACALAPNYTLLLVFRFLVGVGLGGETPVVTSLLSEFIPAKRRGNLQGLLNSFWAVGWLAAALISYFIIPTLGWRWAFVAGALPAFFIFIIRRHLPESPRWLINKGRVDEAGKIVDYIEKITAQKHTLQPVALNDIPSEVAATKQKVTLSTLFSKEYRKRTIMLWGVWFCAMFGYFGLFSWLPSLFVKAGHTMVKSFLYVLIMQIAYVPNQILSAFLMDKVGRKKLLVVNMLLAGAAVIPYGWALGHNVATSYIIVLGVITSLFVSAIMAIIYTYTPELYPTGVRASGVGAASSSSRVGSMLAPIVIGAGLASLGISGVFMIIAGVFILGAILVATLGPETKGVVLED
ncbi:MFS transporter [Candidatus Formimonas warabiya]|uniref:MFS transporter n=1 Tax=Formimonas warabiya TaxID=1761012 RepID=A0A3G1KZE4_FORW1|nr:MFS transporter [Candidatus Formimonas warabiya]ATW27754.1 MFS transporter [Candidatus Formimonas warabiya]